MRRILFALGLWVLLCLPLQAAMDSVQPLYWALTTKSFCTAFSIDERVGFWQTAAHCVTHEYPYTVGGYEARTVWVDADVDLAVVISRAHAKGLPLGAAGVKVGTAIEVQGFPVGMINKLSAVGRMGAVNIPHLDWGRVDVVDLAVARGNSGSPVLSKGKVVGVVVGKTLDGNMGISVPLETIRRVCELFYASR